MKPFRSVFALVSDCHARTGHYQQLWQRHFYDGLSGVVPTITTPRDVEFDWARGVTAPDDSALNDVRAENERRHRALVAELSGRYRLYPGAGEGDQNDWPAEMSVLALGIPEEEAHARGRKWGQLAVLIGARGQPALLQRDALVENRLRVGCPWTGQREVSS